jgi:hypothetical protein
MTFRQSFEAQHAFNGASVDMGTDEYEVVELVVADEAVLVEVEVKIEVADDTESELDRVHGPCGVLEAGSTSGCAAACALEAS